MVELSEGRGFLFFIKNKKNARSPDIHLRLIEGGKEVKMVGWKKLDQNKDVYYTLEKSIEKPK